MSPRPMSQASNIRRLTSADKSPEPSRADSGRCSAYHVASHARLSHAITQARDALTFRAVFATEECTAFLKPVPDDPCSAMIADRREGLNGAFETIECMRLAIHEDLKRLVIIVAASLTNRHGAPHAFRCE